MKLLSLSLAATLLAGAQLQAADWKINSAEDWTKNIKSAEGATVGGGSVSPKAKKTATIATKVHTSDVKRSAKSLIVAQSAIWQNWNPIKNLGPVNLADAPVLLTVGPDNYWMFGRYGSGRPRQRKGQKPKPLPPFKPEAATLEGFDVPLEGLDLMPLFKGANKLDRDALYWHFPHNRMEVNYYMDSTILEGDWKFYKGHGLIKDALFNLKEDPMEKNNVLTNNPKLADRLRGKLNHWLEKISAKMPRR